MTEKGKKTFDTTPTISIPSIIRKTLLSSGIYIYYRSNTHTKAEDQQS